MPKEFERSQLNVRSQMDCTPRLENHYPVALDGRCTHFRGIHSYDLPAQRGNALSQPQVWPMFGGHMGELRLRHDSSVHRFASAVVVAASIAGLRGEF